MSYPPNWTNDETTQFSEQSQPDSRKLLSRKIGLIFMIVSTICMALSIFLTLSQSDSNVSDSNYFDSSSSFDDSSPDIYWAPSDFNIWSKDSNIAWRFSDKNSYSCGDYSCISVDFISREGCPSGLYAAINWLDSNDVVVSYDNATLPTLYPMQTAKLRFDDIEEIGDSGQMAEINCR